MTEIRWRPRPQPRPPCLTASGLRDALGDSTPGRASVCWVSKALPARPCLFCLAPVSRCCVKGKTGYFSPHVTQMPRASLPSRAAQGQHTCRRVRRGEGPPRLKGGNGTPATTRSPFSLISCFLSFPLNRSSPSVQATSPFTIYVSKKSICRIHGLSSCFGNGVLPAGG